MTERPYDHENPTQPHLVEPKEVKNGSELPVDQESADARVQVPSESGPVGEPLGVDREGLPHDTDEVDMVKGKTYKVRVTNALFPPGSRRRRVAATIGVLAVGSGLGAGASTVVDNNRIPESERLANSPSLQDRQSGTAENAAPNPDDIEAIVPETVGDVSTPVGEEPDGSNETPVSP